MINFRADLHCHSTRSDGTLSPAALIALAKKKELQGLSITDHDSVAAYPDCLAHAKQHGIQIVPGVEFSTQYKGISVHVLAYSFDYTHRDLLDLCQRHQQRRKERNLQILDNLAKEGFLIDPKELPQDGRTTVGRPHIAKLLVDKGYVTDIPTVFQLYLGDGKKCYVPGVPLAIPETLEVIHAAQGLAVLAHPHLFKNLAFVRSVLAFPFDGLECEYARMSPQQNEPWISLAQQKGLLRTGGSDFHGAIKGNLELGASTVSWERFDPLLMHFKIHHSGLGAK